MNSAKRSYLLQRGEVVPEAGGTGNKQVVIETVQDGELAGWSWLIPPDV